MALRRSAPEPGDGLREILFDPLAAQVHSGKIALRAGEALAGRQAIPIGGDLQVLRYPEAEPVELADVPLGGGMAGTGERQPFAVSARVVARIIEANAIGQIGTRRRDRNKECRPKQEKCAQAEACARARAEAPRDAPLACRVYRPTLIAYGQPKPPGFVPNCPPPGSLAR